MIMLIKPKQTLFFDSPKDARHFLKCSQSQYEAALDLGKLLNGWCIDEVIAPRKRRRRTKKNDRCK